MRLIRCGQPGQEVPGLIDPNGIIRDLSRHVDDIDGRILDLSLIHI